MANLNKVMLIGRLGQDPEVKDVGDSKVANFSIATNDTWKDKKGEKQEKTEWHSCQAWGRLADLAAMYLFKGNQVYVEGALQTREWTKNNEKRYTTEIKVFKIEFLESKSSSDESEERKHEEVIPKPTNDLSNISRIRSNFEQHTDNEGGLIEKDKIPF